MPRRQPPHRPSDHPFTLVEVLVAVAIVIVVAMLALKFFSNLQNVWQHSVGRTNTHEDGRLALGMVARDLEAALARTDDRPGYDIRFHQPSSSALWLVTDCAADATVSCSLVEVGYRLTEDRIERAFVDQSCPAWNIYGDRDDADDQDGYQVVVDGVTNLEFTCYDDALQPFVPSHVSRLPAVVCVRLSVMDARDAQRWRALPETARTSFEKQVSRTFWKTVQTR
jgi:type II secretory pathway component PulJ